jgi:hypothetical protein
VLDIKASTQGRDDDAAIVEGRCLVQDGRISRCHRRGRSLMA